MNIEKGEKMSVKEKLDLIKNNGKWKNEYFLKLVILDHIDELKVKDTYMKMKDIPKNSNEYRDNFEKELADLYIVLDMYFDNKDEYLDKILDRFINNLDK